jgi:predicted cupin superfamily sugar epimerase
MVCQLQAEELIERLQLLRHPEGGWYRESYRSSEVIQAEALPERFSGDRSISTTIYFLLLAGAISSFHRIKSDEIWHFYSGETLILHVITPQSEYYHLKLGTNIKDVESFQCVVPAGCWFGAEVSGNGYSLVGCTVAPGFDFADFEMGDRDDLISRYPDHKEIIVKMTNPTY